MTYKLGDRTLFKQNSVHAAFYREYLKEEFRMERYEWESCGDTDTGKFPEGKTVFIFPFIRPIPRSTVHCMRHVPKEAAAHRHRCGNARAFVKSRRFYIRNICGWWEDIIRYLGWI